MSRRSFNAKQNDKTKGARRPLTPEQVRDELMDGVTINTLISLGVLTEKGGASPSARRKVKQVNHLLKQMKPALTDIFKRYDSPCIVDMGAGRATVSLALYDRWLRVQDKGQLIAIESRPELVKKVIQATEEDYPRFSMLSGEALKCTLPSRLHLVLGLHACDLATDHAIARAIQHKADYAVLVPCCQAEVAQSLKQVNNADPLSCLWGTAHHRREFGAHLTNVIRSLVLRSVGYAVTVTELTGWEHSMKNELILARRMGRYQQEAKLELHRLLIETGLANGQPEALEFVEHTPWLIRSLERLVQQRDQDPSQSDAQQTLESLNA